MWGMYSLPQSGSNSHEKLKERLNKEGYFKRPLVPALWKHKTRPTQFVLVVDDFGIKYFTKDNLDHLADTLKQYYSVKIDPDGKELVKIELDWDYTNKKVHLLMKPCQARSVRPLACLGYCGQRYGITLLVRTATDRPYLCEDI